MGILNLDEELRPSNTVRHYYKILYFFLRSSTDLRRKPIMNCRGGTDHRHGRLRCKPQLFKAGHKRVALGMSTAFALEGKVDKLRAALTALLSVPVVAFALS